MDQFIQSLKAQVEKAFGQKPPWGDVNPLVVIGLTEAILDLGLTKDQIYAVIRSYGRQLAAQVHPDRKPENVSPERQRQILGAFEVLDNQEYFTNALAQFKNLRAEDRREVRILSQALQAERKRVEGFESQARAIALDRQALAEEHAKFNKLKEEEALVLPDVQSTIAAQNKRITSLERSTKQAIESSKEWKHYFEDAVKYIANLSGNEGCDRLDTHVFEAKWVATVSLTKQCDDPQLSPLDASGEIRNDFRQAALLAGVKKKELTKTINSWVKATKKYKVVDPVESNSLPLGIALLRISAGKSESMFGIKEAAYGGRIVGSIPETGNFPIKRSCLCHGVGYKDVLENFYPFLIPGGVLVSINIDRTRFASWSLRCPAFKFTTKRIILAAG